MNKKVFSYVMIIILFVLALNGNPNQMNIDIKESSWGTVYDKEKFNDYLEVYFSDDKIYYYSNMGLSSSFYKIEEGVFYTKVSESSDFEKKSNIIIKEDSIYFSDAGDSKLVMFRIKDTVSLKSFVNELIDENSFKKEFNKRLLKW